MRTFYFNSFLFKAISCLMFLQLSITLPSHALPKEIDSFEITLESAQELDDLLKLSRKIMKNETLYKYLNKVFAQQLIITDELQKKYNWPKKTKGLSEPQIVFMLHHLPAYQKLLKTYLKKITPDNVNNPENKIFREKMRSEFLASMEKDTILEKIKSLNDPENSLTIIPKGNQTSFHDVSIHFNHEKQPDPSNPNSLTPPEDLEQTLLDFIADAKYSLAGNVLESNLPKVAKAIIEKNNDGVSVLMGVDDKTTNLAEENKIVARMFDEQQNLKNKKAAFEFVRVISVGLNHTKVWVRDAGTPYAAVLVESGNATQSCIGKDGDSVNLPVDLRPPQSKPNANHAVFMKSQFAAVIVMHELGKTLEEKLKGRDQYPISGSYKLANGEINPSNGKPSEVIMAFSPNGGMGSINNTLFKPLILASKGSIMMMQFAASSKDLIDALTQVGLEQIKKGENFDFKFVGDPSFSKREWSIPLFMSGLERDENKIYSENPNFPLKEVEAQLREQIRINPKHFGEYNIKIKLPDGTVKNEKITVKLHHKVFIFPKLGVAVLGTSFNPSDAAESNQEQVMIFKNHPIIKEAIDAFNFLYNENGSITLAKAAEKSNSTKEKDVDWKDLEATDIKKRSEKAKKQAPENKNFRDLSCPAVFK